MLWERTWKSSNKPPSRCLCWPCFQVLASMSSFPLTVTGLMPPSVGALGAENPFFSYTSRPSLQHGSMTSLAGAPDSLMGHLNSMSQSPERRPSPAASEPVAYIQSSNGQSASGAGVTTSAAHYHACIMIVSLDSCGCMLQIFRVGAVQAHCSNSELLHAFYHTDNISANEIDFEFDGEIDSD